MRLLLLVTIGLTFLSACSGSSPTALSPTSLPSLTVPLTGSASPIEGTATVAGTPQVEDTQPPTIRATMTPSQVTPVPESSPTLGPCGGGDFFGEVRSNLSGGTVTFTVSLTAASNKTCLLSGPPQPALVSRQGAPLDLDISWYCNRCGGSEAGKGTPVPAQTAAAGEELNRVWVMKPQDSVRFNLVWSNWCYPLPPGGVSVRLVLPAGNLDLPTDLSAVGRCTAPKQRSTVLVSQYYLQGS